jgi:tRNA pseudouridine55 synthase
VTLDELEAMSEQERMACLLPVKSLLAQHRPVILDSENAGRFLSGVRRRGSWLDDEEISVYGPAEGCEPDQQVLLGTAHVKAGELIPGRLLSPIEVQQILNFVGQNEPVKPRPLSLVI